MTGASIVSHCRNACFLTAFGVQITFVKKSDSYLAVSSDSDMAVIELEQPLRQEKGLPGFGDSAIREAAFTLVKQFNGRPLWNNPHGLLDPFPSVEEMYPKWPLFKSAWERMGSDLIFVDDLYYILTRQRTVKKTKHCEVLGTCNCSNDSHCALGEVCRTKNIGGTPFQFCDAVQT